MTLPWFALQFAVCALLIAVAGYVLSRSADQLAAAYGWGRGWVGVALLATVTSLPELASGISAVALVDAPNLAVGNALGACVVNLAFLVVVDAVQRRQPMYREASSTHLLSAAFGVVMMGFVAMSLAIRAPAVLHVGLYSPLLLAFYLLALRSVHAHDRTERAPDAGPLPAGAGPRLRREWLIFCAAAAVVLVAGTLLPEIADSIALEMGLSRTFVGTILMAVVTTLPEMAVTVAALRLGALDMAIGNLLGSNLFNVVILAVDDAVYTKGSLLAAASPAHGGTAATALIMMGLVIAGLVLRPRGRVLRVVSWVSVGLVAAYAINATVAYLAGI